MTEKFVYASGKPIANHEVILTRNAANHLEPAFDDDATDNNGTFTIPYINFAIPGYYTVQLYGNNWDSPVIKIDGHTPQPVVITVYPKKP